MPTFSFGKMLRRLRKASGWSQEELAERASLTAAAVGALERGERRHPYPQTVRALADALELSGTERAAFFNAVPRRGERGEDLTAELEKLRDEALATVPPSPRKPVPAAPSSSRAAVLLFLSLPLLGGVAWLAFRGSASLSTASPPPMVWTMPPPEGSLYVTTSGPPALSPDGRQLVFLARRSEGPRRLWLRSLAVAEPQPIPLTEDASFPFWSPDSRQVAFFADNQLKKLDLSTGTVSSVARIDDGLAGTWREDGTLLVAHSGARALDRISPSGEVTEVLPGRAPANEWYFAPKFLPDGEHFFVTVLGVASGRPTGIYVTHLETGEASFLLPAVSNIQYVRPGRVVYYHQGALRLQRFDLGSLHLEGDASLLEDDVEYSSYDMSAFFTANEHLSVHLPGGVTAGSELAFFDRAGRRTSVLGEAADYFHPRLSPDGSKLAVDISGGQQAMGDVWILDAVHGGATRLTSDPSNESRPLWSPDGQDVIFVKGKSIYRRSVSGAGEEELVYGGPEAVQPVDWSADGRFLLFSREFADLWVLDLPSGETSPWLVTSFREGPARFSPDGRWVAYCSDETGRFEVYVEDFPDRREKHPVSLGEGRGPVWSRDGKELFFYRPGRGLMAVRLDLGSGFTAEKPQFLFDVEIRVIEGYAFYDVTPDAERFLVNHLIDSSTDKPLVFRTDWLETLGSP